jgi:uncharacterized protein
MATAKAAAGQNPKQPAGTPLSNEDIKAGKFIQIASSPNARYAYDCGIAMARYLEALRQGKLLGVHFAKSGRTVIPPRAFDETDLSPISEWVELPHTGTVNTFSLAYVTWDVRRLEKPEIPAVIDIDGTSPTAGIMHMLGEVDPKKVKVGMRVKAVWKPEAERTGTITDIKYWKPIEG